MADKAKDTKRKVRLNKGATAKPKMEPENRSESVLQDEVKLSLMKENSNEVIGKSMFVYIEDQKIVRNAPAHSESLPPSDFIGEEEDIHPDEVETNLMPEKIGRNVLSEAEIQELMAPAESEPGPDFSTALTFEQLGNVAEVLMSGSGDERKNSWAAEILYQVKDTDLYNFFANEVSTKEEIKRLFRECLEEKGQPLPARKRIQNKIVNEPINWSEYM